MGIMDSTSQSAEYRLIMTARGSQAVWAEHRNGRPRLPRVTIPRYARHAEELQLAIAAEWRIQIVILDLLPEKPILGFCALAEILGFCPDTFLMPVPFSELEVGQVTDDERERIGLTLDGAEHTNRPLSSPGWAGTAMEWLQAAVDHSLPFTGKIRQLNAAGGFMLARFEMQREPAYWLKAVSGPNAHEFGLTRKLAQLCPEFLPPIVGWHEPWNAWWMEEAGEPVTFWTLSRLACAVSTMAALQKRTIGYRAELLNAGASDHCLPTLRDRLGEIFEYLAEVMAMQVSAKAIPTKRDRLQELSQITEDACFRMEALGIPDAIFSTDIQSDNILFKGNRCVFIDWCESAVGNPFTAFEYLCLLEPNQRGNWTAELREDYRQSWLDCLNADQIDQAFALAPVLAIVSCLYGRGTWLHSPERQDPSRQRYARSLVRHLDRAATRNPRLSEVLCR